MSEPTGAAETRAGDDLLAQLADDFIRRLRAGECPAVEEYATKHPDLADRIRGLFPAMLAMEQPGSGATLDHAPLAERVGGVIGRYKLLERIGEGGFGVVFMAEQQLPVRRKVALKVIKPGMDTRQVLARFEAERQALAIMDHPNIAKVFDGGMTESGRPYFVMELVKGVPITDFCDQHQLPPRQRLELFLQVCRAVQHAHTKGIIHRDIKPTNVLVTLHEGVAVPKVIDFGVAKATGQPLTEKTLFTNFAQMVGTPLYMSPEQAEMTGVDVDTRSDVYSLGVLLYELLTGTTPVDKERFKQAAFDEVRRIIREEEPPKPSTRLSESRDLLASISAQRHTDPAKLTRLVRGELDWIVMKALEKDRNRRYETAIGFAVDIQRYLADEPVLAGPPTVRYRFGKFARRHWRVLTAALAFMLLLVTAVVTLSVALVAVNRERQQKETALEAEGRRRKQARSALDAMSSQIIEDWLSNQRSLLPGHKEFLEQALRSYEEFAADTGQDEESRAGVANAYFRVGRIRRQLGQLKDAEAALESSHELYARLVADFPSAPEHRDDLAKVDYDLARLYGATGKTRQAQAAYREALAIHRNLAAEFPNVPGYRRVLCTLLNSLGVLLKNLSQPREAQEAYSEALAGYKRLVTESPDDPEYREGLAYTYGNLGVLLDLTGKSRDAAEADAQAVAVWERLVADFPDVPEYRESLAMSRNYLGNVLRDAGRHAEAEDTFREALRINKSLVAEFPVLPVYRRGLAITLNNLGILFKNTDRAKQAEDVYSQAMTIHKHLADDFPTILDHQNEAAGAMVNLARLLLTRKELNGARRLLEEAVPYHQAALKGAPNNPMYRKFYRLNRWRMTETRIELKDHAAAAESAAQLLATEAEPARDAYTTASLLAGCVRLAAQDERLTESKRQELATTYGDSAIAALRQAIDRGAKEVDQMKTDPSLDPLRSRADFQKLLHASGATTQP